MKKQIVIFIALLTAAAFGEEATEAVEAAQPVVDTGITAWMLTSTALVLLMVPGLAMFYGGLVRTKNVLGTMMHSFAAMAIIGVLWMVGGYALSFGDNILGGWAGWSSDYFLLRGIDQTIMDGGVPEYVFAMFQGKFAIITPALIAGAFAERVKFKTYCFFIAIWSVLVYNPICHWVWHSDGFLFKDGAIDFAGGTVVHISAGISGLVAVLYLGRRKNYPTIAMHPNNLTMTLIGAGLLWVGWFGFNAGSSINSGLDTARALTLTQIAASAGALTWITLEGIQHKKATSLGLASGILAGLVAITPAAGSVTPIGSLALGVIASLTCYGAVTLKNKIGYDDSLDAFGVHGVGGIIGAVFLVFFLREGATNETVMGQLLIQLKAVLITIAYAGGVTFAIIFVLEHTVGMKLNAEDERSGLDKTQHAEIGYGLTNLE